jgi:putative phosphoesterase
MRIGIIADTHGNLEGWQRAWTVLQRCELIIHCGDLLYHGPRFDPAPGYNPRELADAINQCPVPLLICRGNADAEVDTLFIRRPIQAPYVYAQIEGMRVLATHGHHEPLAQTIETAQQWEVDLLVTGHCHVPSLTRYGRLWHLNPGTTTYPLATDPALQYPTCAVYDQGTVTFYELTGEAPQLLPVAAGQGKLES